MLENSLSSFQQAIILEIWFSGSKFMAYGVRVLFAPGWDSYIKHRGSLGLQIKPKIAQTSPPHRKVKFGIYDALVTIKTLQTKF